MNAAAVANAAWRAASAPATRAYRRALEDPEGAQWRLLRDYLRANSGTAYGRRHGFARIRSVSEFQRWVPVVGYEELAPYVERIRRGERGVLTAGPVRRLVPSAGSTAARKIIPWTDAFAAEFRRAVGVWAFDVLRRPALRRGPAYWSVSPAVPTESPAGSALPIGFDEDSEYLGGALARLVRGALAVPETLRHAEEPEALLYLTALGLLRCRELRLVSVWHPSFLALLLDALERRWPALLDDVTRGTLSPPGGIPERVRRSVRVWEQPDPRRARELAEAGPGAPQRLWPRLALVSCWADGPAAGPAAALRRRLPGVALQPKGLLATEGVVSLPLGSRRPLAVTSHFLEFLDGEGRARTVAELRVGETVSVVLTTGAGLVRYRLGDRVRVTGVLGRTPCVEFVGREDGLSDVCGEKLSPGFVARTLEEVLGDGPPAFAMLAPDRRGDRPSYTLYVEGGPLPAGAAERLDDSLSANPHYRLCRRLGQLGAPSIFRISAGGAATYLERERAAGRRLGEIKPCSLSPREGWSQRFAGGYVGEVGAGGRRADFDGPPVAACGRGRVEGPGRVRQEAAAAAPAPRSVPRTAIGPP